MYLKTNKEINFPLKAGSGVRLLHQPGVRAARRQDGLQLSAVGIIIIVMLPIGILTSYVLWKKGKIQVVDKEQK